MRIPENVIYRFESQIDGGTTFLFNLDSMHVKTTNELGYHILRLIDQGREKEEILVLFTNTNIGNSARVFVQRFIDSLIDEGFIEE